MKISSELIEKNVVIVANNFNMSILSQHWLMEKNILNENDFKTGFTFTSLFAQVQTDNFLLTLVPDRLQFSIKPVVSVELDLILSKVGKIVEELPETPYSAVGFNYVFFANPIDSDVKTFTKSLFYNEKSSLFKNFDEADSRFGGYLSKDILGSRLRLEIRPVIVNKIDPTTGSQNKMEKIQLSFNFQKDILDTDKTKTMIDFLNQWDKAKNISNDIINSINKE